MINPPKFDQVEDMAELMYMHEPAVVNNLTQRYIQNDIYVRPIKSQKNNICHLIQPLHRHILVFSWLLLIPIVIYPSIQLKSSVITEKREEGKFLLTFMLLPIMLFTICFMTRKINPFLSRKLQQPLERKSKEF